MLEQTTLYVVVENDADRRIHAVCATAEEAERARNELRATMDSPDWPTRCATELSIFAMHAVYPGGRYRLVYGTPKEVPVHPLEVPAFEESKVTNTDAHSEGYVYPDELYVHRKEALAAAARHNTRQLQRSDGEPLDWAVVVELGEPLWRRYRSECLVRRGVGWEDSDLVRPVRIIHPTAEEASLPNLPGP